MFAGNSYKCGWIEYVEVEYSADAEKTTHTLGQIFHLKNICKYLRWVMKYWVRHIHILSEANNCVDVFIKTSRSMKGINVLYILTLEYL